VGHDDENRAGRGVQLQQERRDSLGGRAVEVTRRFVAEEQRRIPDERPGERGALLLAAGELRGTVIEAIGQPHTGEQLARSCAVARRIGRARPGDERRRQHVLEHRALRQEGMVLEHEADVLVAERRLCALAERVGIAPVECDPP
jgi:hypothetical protein